MATKETGWPAPPASTPGPPPGGVPGHVARAAGPFSGRRGPGVAWLGERTQAAVEKRGPYMVMRMPSIQAKLQKHRDLAKSVLRRKGMLGASPNRPDSSGKRLVKFNKGYTALSQSPDENLVSFNSDSDGELESRYSSGYSSAEPELSGPRPTRRCNTVLLVSLLLITFYLISAFLPPLVISTKLAFFYVKQLLHLWELRLRYSWAGLLDVFPE
ncbi:protein FAM219B isoform X1 [Artibeus jamaicensis]|uniref:protein FAM219B isoform X1 n=1 Tax=Artibeus jamaicensis TaxID=9417 RepID=UPI00235A97BD|nr:protein FAM219B isoform X1 [Artibeus jamaicensis]